MITIITIQSEGIIIMIGEEMAMVLVVAGTIIQGEEGITMTMIMTVIVTTMIMMMISICLD